MNTRQKIILHKALGTNLELRSTDAARLDVALRLLGHNDLAHSLDLTSNHVQWAAQNLAEVEASAPKTLDFIGREMPEETPALLEAREHVKRYQQEWWALKAKIDAVSKGLEKSIDLAEYAEFEEANVPS